MTRMTKRTHQGADIGAMRLDLPARHHRDAAARHRMDTMAGHLGVSLRSVWGNAELTAAMSQTCARCHAPRTCERAAEGIARLDKAACPNATRFENLRRTQARAQGG